MNIRLRKSIPRTVLRISSSFQLDYLHENLNCVLLTPLQIHLDQCNDVSHSKHIVTSRSPLILITVDRQQKLTENNIVVLILAPLVILVLLVILFLLVIFILVVLLNILVTQGCVGV